MLYNSADHERIDFLGVITNIDVTTLDIAFPIGFKYVFDSRKYLPYLGPSLGPSFAIVKDVSMIKLNDRLGFRTRFNTGDYRLYNYNTIYLSAGMKLF